MLKRLMPVIWLACLAVVPALATTAQTPQADLDGIKTYLLEKSTALVGVVLLVMVGNTVHVLQAVDWLPITPVQGMYVPLCMGQWLGIFPTWQGLILQLVTVIYIFGSYYLAERGIHRKRDQAVRRGTVQVAET